MPTEPHSSQTFTGRRGKHATRFSVRFTDRIASSLITVGGIGTILSVSLVFVLLVWVVGPLFRSASLDNESVVRLAWSGAPPISVMVDEYGVMGCGVFEDGRLVTFQLNSGQIVEERAWVAGASITSVARTPGDSQIAVGLSDGTVRLGTIEFVTRYINPREAPTELADLDRYDQAIYENGVVEWTPQQQLRLQTLQSPLGEPHQVGEGPVTQLDHVVRSRDQLLVARSGRGPVRLARVREQENLLTGETTQKISWTDLAIPGESSDLMQWLCLPGRGENVYAIWKSGRLVRWDVRNLKAVEVAEELDLTEGDAAVTAIAFALGRGTLFVGDSRGGLQAWTRVRNLQAKTTNGQWLLPIHTLETAGPSVTTIGISERNRMLVAGRSDGTLALYHATTNQQLLTANWQRETEGLAASIQHALLTPKNDRVWACTAEAAWQASLDPAFPEATVAALARPVWYESYDRPDVVWQSSFAGVASEMKLGLWPLVFGTLKATFYSMLFGAPLALLAAIYTSEFLSARYRTGIKSLVEMMASLPSVVLGFLAALVIAPVVEGIVPATLCAVVTIPVSLLAGAYLWQQLPPSKALAWQSYRLLAIATVVLIGGWAASWLGPFVEQLWFAGDIKIWLDGQAGTGTGAWMFLFLPLTALLVGVTTSLLLNPWIRNRTAGWSRGRFAVLNLFKFALGCVAVLTFAWLISASLTAVGWDPRGTYVSTYVQRNALVVGFVMGFAVIPIIYTIAEDALSTVPSHLRTGSLGVGATPWQTTWRIVIPSAMSGLFSALMIGLGRAVGETMIVLMAAGNTAVLEWNVFNGFRTLSANIAVELPEAVRDSTHYRTLFLAALVLFVMTFVVNTVAELIRLRFRRRAVNL